MPRLALEILNRPFNLNVAEGSDLRMTGDVGGTHVSSAGTAVCFISAAVLVLGLGACAAANPHGAAPAPAKPAHTAARSADHIYVTQDSLDSACYEEVGEVSYVEEFAEAAVESDQLEVAERLRAAAAKKFPGQVDAIINVHSADHNVGSEVEVSGDAVRLAPPGKLDCKLPEKLVAVFAGFATTQKMGAAMHAKTGATGFNGPAGTSNSAQEDVTMDPSWQVKENLRRSIISTMPGQTQVDEQPLIDQIELRQAQIKKLRREIDRLVEQRCAAEDAPQAQCEAMRRAAELRQPHEIMAVANQGADARSPSAFEMQNQLQAENELIEKLRHQLADLNQAQFPPGGAAR